MRLPPTLRMLCTPYDDVLPLPPWSVYRVRWFTNMSFLSVRGTRGVNAFPFSSNQRMNENLSAGWAGNGYTSTTHSMQHNHDRPLLNINQCMHAIVVK